MLDRIYRDEIGHVAAGMRWFEFLCDIRGSDKVAMFQELVRRYFTGALQPPFNHRARAEAGFAAVYYETLPCADAHC